MSDTASDKLSVENPSGKPGGEKTAQGTIGKIKIDDIKPNESIKGAASLPKLGLGVRG